MIPGYDCPHDAVYLPSIIHGPVGSMKNPRAICIFERDMERPLNRHRGRKYGETGVVKDYALVVRSITIVGKWVLFLHFLWSLFIGKLDWLSNWFIVITPHSYDYSKSQV